MTDDAPGADTGHAAGDPVNALLLGLAGQLDQWAALIGGGSAPDLAAVVGSSRLSELVGELGTLVGELGDLLARLLTTAIAVLEAIAEMLRSSPGADTASPGSTFESIPVRIGTGSAHP